MVFSTEDTAPIPDDLQILGSALASSVSLGNETWPEGRDYFSSFVPSVEYGNVPPFGRRLVRRLDSESFQPTAASALGLIAIAYSHDQSQRPSGQFQFAGHINPDSDDLGIDDGIGACARHLFADKYPLSHEKKADAFHGLRWDISRTGSRFCVRIAISQTDTRIASARSAHIFNV